MLSCHLILCVILLAVAAAYPQPSPAWQSSGEPYAVVAGTVFRPPGFALPEAEVVVTPEDSHAKQKPRKLKANRRGEFAVRLPVVPARYRILVQHAGYRPQEQALAIEGEGRTDLSFTLEPDTK